ncbi:reverse transcriptase domain-containing protein [Tanacetum coccineum]
MRFPDIPSTSIKLTLFSFSLEGSARIWLEKEPPRSILTWDDLVSKFINQFFPPSKTTNLRNEITRFQQRFDESFYDAWDRFNDLLRACPHHGFSELQQLDTFYNALNANDQDSLIVRGVELFGIRCLGISPDVAALTTEVFELKNLMKIMLIDKQKGQAPATVKRVEQRTNSSKLENNFDQVQVYHLRLVTSTFYQAQTYQAPAQQMQGVSKTDFENYVKANDAVLRNMQNQGQCLQNQMTNLTEMLSKFVNSNTASSSSPGSLPSNTVTNPKEDLKGITTRSGIAYQGPTIPTSSPRVVERRTEVTKDTIFPTINGITEDVQPPVVPVEKQNPVSEPDVAPVSAPMPNQKPLIPYPSRRNDEKATVENTSRALIDVYEGELTLRVGNEAITYNLDQTSRYSVNYNDMTANRINVVELACEEYSQEVLGFSDVIASGNPTPYYDPIVSNSSPTLTPFGDSDFLILEEADAFLPLADDPTSPKC